MRKWLGIYIAVCAAALCILSGALGAATAGRADFGKAKEESGSVCQVVRTKNESYILYRNPEQKKFKAVRTCTAANGLETLDTSYRGGVYYLYRGEKGGRQFFGIDALAGAGGEEWQPLLETEGEALAFSSNEREFLCSVQNAGSTKITEYSLSLVQPEEWVVKASFDLPKDHFAVCGAYDGEEFWFALEDGRVYRRTTVLEPVDEAAEDTILAGAMGTEPVQDGMGAWKTYWILETAKILLIPVLAGCAALVFLIYGARKRNHIVFRLLCCTEALCCAAMVFACWYISEGLTRQKVLEIGIEAGHLLGEMQAGQNADGTVHGSAYRAAMEERKALLEELMILRPEDGSVVLAKTLPAGTKAAAYYGADIDEITGQVAEGRRTVMTRLKNTGSRPYVVAMRDWTEMQPDSVLLAVLSENGLERAVSGETGRVWQTLMGLLVLLTLLHLGLYVYFSRKWENFVKGISFVATEKKAYPETPAARDGLQNAWVPLDRIGHNLSELYYERDRFYRSYYRFVPKDMERLLNKPEIVDIEIGDRNKIRGCMAHFVLEDLKKENGEDYMELMTASMELLHQARRKWDGIYLGGTADLLERKMFFEQNARNAAQFSVELLHALAVHELLGDKNLIMMLYAADFQYGISGVKDMTMPYIYAREERTLEPYVKSLARAKVKLAMTEQTVRLLGAGFSTRYIGFVTNGEDAGSLKLYECLDAYPETQRKTILETDRLFQKGLQLFYSDDFYLARNTFNEVLKINEQDRIARWYLFHCEYHLNKTGAAVSYGLFENTVLAEEYDNL